MDTVDATDAMDVTDVVEAPAGTLIGRRTGRVRRFLGIPFAGAPVGARRSWLYSFEWSSPVLGGAVHCADIPFFFDVLDAPGTAEALGTRPPADLAAAMHADLAAFVHGGSPAWERATGRLGDPAREYGAPGATPTVDTTGVYDPVVAGSDTAEAR
ncbi:hypothetical protein [Streptomyces sp. NBC_01538]|uniref:hypothetical protein n=1 Tax=Streptomyces sp. NBC_01538 TaxID=2903897 RepID=UPI00386AFA61